VGERTIAYPTPERLTTPAYKGLLDQCIHCGLCLPACPTYEVFHTEMDGPRGRIALMRAASEGQIALDDLSVQQHLDRCLGCRACETACPSGVQYGVLLEEARAAVAAQRTPGRLERLGRYVFLRSLMPHRGRLRGLARVLRLYQAAGLHRVAARMRLPDALRRMEALLPPLQPGFPRYRRLAAALGEKRGTVAFLHGCVQDAFLGRVNDATVRVLQRNGYEVVVPRRQTCCGAAALHVGEEALARTLARRNIDAFEAGRYDAVLNNAGGCGAMLQSYGHLLRDNPGYAEKAKRFVAQVQDVGAFLATHLHVPPEGRIDARVTYADSCHLRHGQGVVEAPRALLRRIPGITLIELQHPDRCCGSAGVYNIAQPEIADTILNAKMADIRTTGARYVVTTNTGCHLQLIQGVQRAGLNAEVVHLVELLDQSYNS